MQKIINCEYWDFFLGENVNKIEAINWFVERHRSRLICDRPKLFKSFSNKYLKAKEEEGILSFLQKERIPRLSGRAQLALAKWMDGSWPIILSSKIPTPREMLEAQARGRRVVSWLPNIEGPILDKADNYEFMLHDLMHAERFFYSSSLHRAQVGFFSWLLDLKLEMSGPNWDYLSSDMNTHPLHALQYLKHMLYSQEQSSEITIPHWEHINSPEFPQLPKSYVDEISFFFQNYPSNKVAN